MRTLSEKILWGNAGEYVDRNVDRAYVHDGTGVLTLESWRKLGEMKLAESVKHYLFFDHISPANNSITATLQAELREFASTTCMHLSDIGGGICHQVMSEGLVLPGEVIVGADSHTCTLGAFGAFATGMGATDLAAIWLTGKTWFKVPESIGISVEGKLRKPAEAKDCSLTYVGRLGADGATYCALEFIGEGIKRFTMDERMVLCNMAVETGAKTGIVYADEITQRYLSEYGVISDQQKKEDCSYKEEIEITLDDIVPMISLPPRVDKVRPVTECSGIPLDQVFVGTCTNGRYSDLKRFSQIIRGKKVSVRTIVVPASREVLRQISKTRVLRDILEAGCTLGVPGCGPCLGAHMGVIGEREICLSTSNRNFQNRMGVGGEIYLSSVATAAASAIRGEITDPEEVM